MKSKLISSVHFRTNYNIQDIIFVYDGACPFCENFALLSKIRSGIGNLVVVDGRDDLPLLIEISKEGYKLTNGAILIVDGNLLHGSQAVQFLCSRMQKDRNNFTAIAALMSSEQTADFIYPFLLFARRIILFLKSVPINPI